MAKVRKNNKIYIYREIDGIIEQQLKNKEGKFLYVQGQGGVGKSTLLKKFLSYKATELPTIYINMQENKYESFVDILLDDEVTIVKHCPQFEKIRETILKEPKLLGAFLDRYSSELNRAVEELSEEDKEWGQYAKAIIDLAKFGSGFWNKKTKDEQKEILNNPEFILLNAIAEDLEERGLFIVDTFEKVKESNIKSKIKFEESGEIALSFKERNYRFKDYIEGLVYLLVESTTFLVAGRNPFSDLAMELDEEDVVELDLERFSLGNIKEFFREFAKKHPKLGEPSQEHLDNIEKLTQGNPLLVELFSELAKGYKSWDELDYAEMERRVKEDGLVFYFTDRIISHLDEQQAKELWKLVIPRVLHDELEEELFEKEGMYHSLVESGLAQKAKGRSSGKIYLHDEVHRAIETHFEQKFGKNLSSWHDKEEVKSLHLKLKTFFEKNSLHRVNSNFEACYHNIMTKDGFEKEFEVKREEFATFALGSISLNFEVKERVCSSFQILSNWQISELIKTFQDEHSKWNKIFSAELYSELHRLNLNGRSNQIIEDLELLIELKNDRFKKDWSLFYLIGDAYNKKEEYDNAIEAYKKAVEINPKKDEAYYSMGNAYVNKEEYDNAIEAYKKAVEINPKRDEAYNNMGIAYGNKKEYDNAIEAYKKAVEINPKKDEAYNNMGSAYDDKEEYDNAIEAYKKAVEINPKYDGAYNNMGIVYRKKGDYDNAIEAYKKAVEINPKCDGAYNNMGIAYDNKKEYDNAIEAYKKAVEINPKKDEAYYNMGIAYYHLEKFDEVINAYTKVLQINPNKSGAYANLFELQLTQNQPFDQTLEAEYLKRFSNQKDTFIHYEMLKILQAIANHQEANVEEWTQKYKDVGLGGWSSDELDTWVEKMDNGEVKERLVEALGVFKNHGEL